MIIAREKIIAHAQRRQIVTDAASLPVHFSQNETTAHKPPLEIYSLNFTNAFPLQEVAADRPDEDVPQWLARHHSQAIAYAGQEQIALTAAFLIRELVRPYDILLGCTELGDFIPVAPEGQPGDEIIALPDGRITKAIPCLLDKPLPAKTGKYELQIDWVLIRLEKIGLRVISLGHTVTDLYITHGRIVSLSGSDEQSKNLSGPIYTPIMAWSSAWCSDLPASSKPEALCDRLIEQLHRSGLAYTYPGGNSLRGLLINRAGACGQWSDLFQQLARCQGVLVEQRMLNLIIKESEPAGQPHKQKQWTALVVDAPGINEKQPTQPPRHFYDNDIQYPIPAGGMKLKEITSQRYLFCGLDADNVDFFPPTHAVCFLKLENEGRCVLYDPSFGRKYLLAMSVPQIDDSQTGDALKPLKTGYLDKAVSYLAGALYNGDDFYDARDDCETHSDKDQLGIMVKTELIPADEIVIQWSG